MRKMNHPNIMKLKEVFRENDILYFVFEYMECNLYQLMKDRRGYFHRNLKPENLSVTKDVIKMADFGLARKINSQPPYTECLYTLVLSSRGSSEADEIYKICSVMGSPTWNSWAEGLKLANAINYQFPQFSSIHLSVLIPSTSEDAINLITSLCSWDPYKRPTALEALQHPFFQSFFYVPPSLHPRTDVTRTPPSGETKGALEQKSARRCSTQAGNE
ncbi:Cyclin-dependent kinase F-4 [Vitis vinifera]|uniref:Cyclin-dependent kinase F-4 n=1 Tax=Vitis vinifera TaxID=29760 RepID=A0A438IBL8_VITVI|nr:Cyclin-dependent kinase F-4 [Vitis vinifera]